MRASAGALRNLLRDGERARRHRLRAERLRRPLRGHFAGHDRRDVLLEVDRIHGHERAAVDEHLQAPGQLAAVHSNRPGKLRGGDRFAVHGQDGIDDREGVVTSPGFDARRALAAPDLDADLLGLYGEACAENDAHRDRTHRAQPAAAEDAGQNYG